MPRVWSVGTSCRLGQVGAAERLSYRNTAEANQPKASQIAAHSPSDRNNTVVIDTRSDQ
jgi:hypothetical protein